jgi:hypothetical protein
MLQARRLHPEFDVALVSNPDKLRADIPSHEQVRHAWNNVNDELSRGFERMSWSDWLQRHSAVSAEDFAKDTSRNRFAILLSRTNHQQFRAKMSFQACDLLTDRRLTNPVVENVERTHQASLRLRSLPVPTRRPFASARESGPHDTSAQEIAVPRDDRPAHLQVPVPRNPGTDPFRIHCGDQLTHSRIHQVRPIAQICLAAAVSAAPEMPTTKRCRLSVRNHCST